MDVGARAVSKKLNFEMQKKTFFDIIFWFFFIEIHTEDKILSNDIGTDIPL